MDTKAPSASPTFTGTTTVSGDLVPATPLSHRNMIINGAMQVSQRGTSFTSVTASAYHLDRFQTVLSSIGTYTVTQDTSAPAGFKNSYKIACTGANSSIGTGDAGVVYYYFEGQDVQHLQYNLSSALTTTLSFWIKAKETGNYQVNLVGNNRQIGKTYTVNVADTWEKKTVTFAGDTGGDWSNSNQNTGGRIEWWLEGGTDFTSGAVPTSWEATSTPDRNAGQTAQKIGADTANYWQITGVQWELGSNATPFEHRSHKDELLRCQRYYYVIVDQISGTPVSFANTGVYHTNLTYFYIGFPVQMRSAPSYVQVSGSNYYAFYANSTSHHASGFTSDCSNVNSIRLNNSNGTLPAIGYPGWWQSVNDGAFMAVNAEL